MSSSSGSISLIRLVAGKCGYITYITTIASGCISAAHCGGGRGWGGEGEGEGFEMGSAEWTSAQSD